MHHFTTAWEHRWVGPIGLLVGLGLIAAGLALHAQTGDGMTAAGRLLFLVAALRITYLALVRSHVRRHQVTRSVVAASRDDDA